MFNDEIGEFDYMDMPTPCQKCNSIFDLHDGGASEKWFPNTTICQSCSDEEKQEIEQDEYIDDLLYNLDIPESQHDHYKNEIIKKLIELKNHFS